MLCERSHRSEKSLSHRRSQDADALPSAAHRTLLPQRFRCQSAQVVEFFNNGAERNIHLDPELRGKDGQTRLLGLSAAEIDALVLFLRPRSTAARLIPS